jgi:divalent metal cation (Fe/Co/Zn/Cd) transporter
MTAEVKPYDPEQLSAKDKALREQGAQLLYETLLRITPHATLQKAYEIYDNIQRDVAEKEK